MSYVPTYLTNVEREWRGWPKFAAEHQAWFTARAEALLAAYPKPHIDLETANRMLWNGWGLQCQAAPPISTPALWDAQFSVTHRALLEADSRQVWTTV